MASKHADATTVLLAALVENGGELTRGQCAEALSDFDELSVKAAIAELEATHHMHYDPRTRLYGCPLALSLHAGRAV